MRLLICLTLLFSFCTDYGAAQVRRALVIGNDSYPGNALLNARNDAKGVFKALQAKGYVSTLALNADRATLSSKIDGFVASIHQGDVAFFYYAGHGMQVAGENYLIPVDFRLTSETAATEQAYALSSLLERLTSHGATTQVVILDACRNNPFLGSRSLRGGWAGFGTSAGAFLAFGTSPGSTASDDPSQGHGLFTQSLLRYLTTSNLDIEEMFRKVREDVIRNSNGTQVPWVSSSLIGTLHVDPQLDQHATLLGDIPHFYEGTQEQEGRALQISDPNHDTNDAEEAQIQSAVEYARGERFDKAISILKGVLSLNPRSSYGLRLLGLFLHATGRDIEAVEALNRAVEVSGVDPRAAAYRCALESSIGASDADRDCAASAVAQPSADMYLAYAGALAIEGDTERAYTNATHSISSGGGSLAYAMRGVVAKAQGREGLATRDLTTAIQLDGKVGNR